jgi:hypothetical protein
MELFKYQIILFIDHNILKRKQEFQQIMITLLDCDEEKSVTIFIQSLENDEINPMQVFTT